MSMGCILLIKSCIHENPRGETLVTVMDLVLNIRTQNVGILLFSEGGEILDCKINTNKKHSVTLGYGPS